MAVITAALLETLRTQFRRDFQDTYAANDGASFWRTVATEVMSGGKDNTYGWLGDAPELREWIGARVVKDMREHSYSIVNKLYESTVGVQRTDINDDNLGVYRPLMQNMGLEAARHPDRLLAGLIKAGDSTACFDGQNFFDTDHPVNANHDGSGADVSVSNIVAGAGNKWWLLCCDRPLKPFIHQVRERTEFTAKTNPQNSDDVFNLDRYVYGVRSRCNVGYGFWQQAIQSQAPLNQDGFNAAYQMMQEFAGDGGRPLGIVPTHLVVAPNERANARKTIKAMTIDGGDSNTNYEAVTVVEVPWLA